jgi:hypothetical protein
MRPLRALAVMLLACAGPCAGPALAADKLPPLDAEFLEYLGSFGSDEEEWALFADEDEDEPAAKPPPAEQPPARQEGSKTEAAAKPAADKR